MRSASFAHLILVDRRLIKLKVSDETIFRIVVILVVDLIEEPLEGVDLEFVESGANVVGHLIDLVVVVRAGGEPLEQ